MRNYGAELRRRRIDAGFKDLKVFAPLIGVSVQHLSQVETAYSRDGRPAVGLGDEAMEAVARVLEWRVIEQRAMLGQIPDSEIAYEADPDFEVIREAYHGADASDRAYLRETAERLKRIRSTQDLARRGAIGGRLRDENPGQGPSDGTD